MPPATVNTIKSEVRIVLKWMSTNLLRGRTEGTSLLRPQPYPQYWQNTAFSGLSMRQSGHFMRSLLQPGFHSRELEVFHVQIGLGYNLRKNLSMIELRRVSP